MADTTIEWTEKTWNPTSGCDRVSPGCDNCYALTMAKRLKGMGSAKYQRDGDPRTSGPGFGLTTHEDALTVPLSWKKPQRVFVNSMSDLFHQDVPDEFIADVWHIMAKTPQHTYQILTKRHARMRSWVGKWCSHPKWTQPLSNVWLGCSVENQQWADIRIPALLDTPAAVRFLSCEPLLSPVDLSKYLDRMEHTGTEHRPDIGNVSWYRPSIGWVIAGGESGPGARRMDEQWARDIVNQCQAADVPVFVKQMGSVWAYGLKDKKGGTWDLWPTDLRVREYPTAVTQ